MGVATVPDYARAFADTFDVSFVGLRAPAIDREFYLYQKRGLALSPAAEAFATHLAQQARRPGRT